MWCVIITHTTHMMASAYQLEKGTKVSKEEVYSASERWFAHQGRGMVAGKGGSRQRVYFCDQRQENKCPASIRWVKQTTGEWKVSNVDDAHVNCAGAMTSGFIRGKSHIIEDIVCNDTGISGPKLKKAAEGKAGGGKLHLRSYQRRAKKRMAEGDAAQEAALMHKLRPYFEELEEHSPGTVTNVEVRSFVCESFGWCCCLAPPTHPPFLWPHVLSKPPNQVVCPLACLQHAVLVAVT